MPTSKLKKQIRREQTRATRNSHRLLLPGLILLLIVLLLGGWWGWMVVRPRWEMEQAERALARGHHEQALRYLQRVYQDSPALAPEAMLRAGRLMNRYLGQQREAILLFLHLEERFPNSPQVVPALRETARIYHYRLEDMGRAIATLQRLQELLPAEADRFQYDIADAYFRLDNPEQARIEFDLLLKRWPQSSRAAEAGLRIGLIYSLEGKGRQAEEAFQRVIDAYPDSSFALEAQLGLAGQAEERGDLVAAAAILQDLQGRYQPEERLQQRLQQVRERMQKKYKGRP